VQLVLANQLSPLLDAGYVEETVRRHFQPLLHATFVEVLRRHYPHGVRFEVDGRELAASPGPESERAPVAIRLGRRRTPSALGYVERNGLAVVDREGVAISTFGKVIKRGWDWLGLAPAGHARITGLIEAPDLAACLTLSKNDFIRTGSRGATYLAYRKAIQEVVSRQLAEWGDRRDGDARPRIARLERDLERVLEDLADDFPLLRSLVDRRPGGQKRLPMPGRGGERVAAPLFANLPVGHEATQAGFQVLTESLRKPPEESTTPTPEPSFPAPEAPRPADSEPAQDRPSLPPDEGHGPPSVQSTSVLATVAGRRRPARYGLLVQFESRPGDPELGRLVDSTIWINEAHPAYARAVASRSLGYHSALAVALALAPLAVEPSQEHAFITQFLSQWGGAEADKRAVRRHRARA
jgi:hypothetical protein